MNKSELAARLAASERMSSDELRYVQEGAMRELLLFCFESVEAYRPYWQHRKAVQADPFATLLRVPPLTRTTYRRNPPAYAGKRIPPPEINMPGGLRHDGVFWRRCLSWHNCAPGRLAALIGLPPAENIARRTARWLAARAAGAFVLDAFALYPDALPYKALTAFRPAYVYALGAALPVIAEPLRTALGPEIPIFLTGDAWEDTPPGISVYETAECGLIASACPEGRLHIHAERYWVEILAGEEGEGGPLPPGVCGQIAVTDMHNTTLPRLRYLTGDTGALSDTPCPCGRTLPVLTALNGRREAMLVCPDGKHIHGRALDALKAPYKGVARYQLIQTGPHAVLSVQKRGGASAEDAQDFHRDVAALLDGVHVELALTDNLPPGTPRLAHTIFHLDVL